MNFPLSKADEFVENISVLTAVIGSQLGETRHDVVRELVGNATPEEISNAELTSVVLAACAVAKARQFSLGEAILEAVS